MGVGGSPTHTSTPRGKLHTTKLYLLWELVAYTLQAEKNGLSEIANKSTTQAMVGVV